MTDMHHYTDYEAALIYLTAVEHGLTAPNLTLIAQLPDHLRKRHSTGSITMRWTDFRTAVNPELKPTRGARLPQIRRIVKEFEFLTKITLRDDLLQAA